jgi:SAM-dependent methyltransferase
MHGETAETKRAFSRAALWDRWRCPDCNSTALAEHPDEVICGGCGTRYPLATGRPVLIRTDNVLFPRDCYLSAPGTVVSRQGARRFVPEISANLARTRCLGRFAESFGGAEACVLVVGSGTQRSELLRIFGEHQNVRFICCDIDVRANVDCFCDAHDLPFRDSSFDGVITCAVLEHVIRPERVVEEIHRVVRIGGSLYSELPFMQQVHEGAFDFTRYTLSGHRRLFNGFGELEAGLVAGPGTALAWAVENFFLSFVRSRPIRLASKVVARCLFFWLKYFDYLMETNPQALDAASCTYLLGVRRDVRRSDEEIVAAYTGGKKLEHTR